MHKVKTRNRLELIDCWGVQSAVALHLYKEGGLDPLQTDFRVNPAVLGNKSREKLGTLTDSAHTPPPRTVRPRDRTVRTALFSVQHMSPCLLVKVDEPKAYELNLM
jgi:hypothetical protein